MTIFQAFRVHLNGTNIERRIEECHVNDLPPGDVLIKVAYSSLNYKDALSASGHKGVTAQFPHTPGIDASGTVVIDKSGHFVEGDPVVVTGFDLGMNTWGGFSEYIRVPVEWVLPLPDGLSMADSMRIGTAGITAAYCLEKLLQNGLSGNNAKIIVTGATGGVGSTAVHLLSSLGYQVTASTGKLEESDWLKSIGAKCVLDRKELSVKNKRALLTDEYDAAVDTVGEDTLVNIIKSLKFGGSVASCGIVSGTGIPLDIFPFILRNVNLLGIASADASLNDRKRVLSKYVTLWRLSELSNLCVDITLNQLSDRIDNMLAGNIKRRAVIKVS